MVLKPVLKNWINYQPQLAQDFWTIKPYVQECMICTACAKKINSPTKRLEWNESNENGFRGSVLKHVWTTLPTHRTENLVKVLFKNGPPGWWRGVWWRRWGPEFDVFSVLTLSWDGNVLVGLEGFPGFLRSRGHDQGIPRESFHPTSIGNNIGANERRIMVVTMLYNHEGIWQTLPWNCAESTTVLEIIDDYLPGNNPYPTYYCRRTSSSHLSKGIWIRSPGVYPDFFLRQDDGSLPGSLPKRTGGLWES